MESMFQTDVTTIIGEGTHGRLTERTSLVNLDILSMCCEHVLLFAGKFELAVGHLADPVVLLADVPIVVSEATLNCSTLAARLVHPEAKSQ